MLTPTTSTTRSRQLAATTIGRPLLTMLQTMLAGTPDAPTGQRAGVGDGPRRRSRSLRRR
jgi:hypothetical protein